MEIKKGVAVSPGISIGKCLVIDAEDYRIPRRLIEPSQRLTETQRVRNAFKDAIDELTQPSGRAKGNRRTENKRYLRRAPQLS